MCLQKESTSTRNTSDGGSAVDIETGEVEGINDEKAEKKKHKKTTQDYCILPWKRENRPTAIASMIVLLGAAATAAFLGLGITSSMRSAEEDFKSNANTIFQGIEMAFHDYEVAALWTYQACTTSSYTHDFDGFTQDDFRQLYERIRSTGIDAQIEFLPKVSHADRPKYEQRSREYYSRAYNYQQYAGFVGLEPINGTAQLDLLPRSPAEYYYPIHFIQPVEGSEAALDLDVYSRPRARYTIDRALQTWKPALSEPAPLVEETVEHALSVFFFHPGTPLESSLGRPSDLSLLVIRIPNLIIRAMQQYGGSESTSIYLWDTTGENLYGIDVEENRSNPKEMFLGAAELLSNHNMNPNNNPNNTTWKTTLFAPATLNQVQNGNRLVHTRVLQIADRKWTIAVAAVDGTYEAEYTYVIVGSVLLLVCSFIVAAFVYFNIRYSNMRKKVQLREVQSANEKEKASLVLENATKAAQAERRLNDFIAYVVFLWLSATLTFYYYH